MKEYIKNNKKKTIILILIIIVLLISIIYNNDLKNIKKISKKTNNTNEYELTELRYKIMADGMERDKFINSKKFYSDAKISNLKYDEKKEKIEFNLTNTSEKSIWINNTGLKFEFIKRNIFFGTPNYSVKNLKKEIKPMETLSLEYELKKDTSDYGFVLNEMDLSKFNIYLEVYDNFENKSLLGIILIK